MPRRNAERAYTAVSYQPPPRSTLRGSLQPLSQALPLVGRVSMDTITVDVSALPEHAIQPGTLLDLIAPQHSVDAVAERAGTIGYEMLTSLGNRYHRTYLPAD